MANLGRITGPLLSKNLLRKGVDLAFEDQLGDNLLFLDVNSHSTDRESNLPGTGKIGIKTNLLSKDFVVNSAINTTNLLVDTRITIPDIELLSDNSITSVLGDLKLVATNYVHSDNIRTDDINFDNNVISTVTPNTILELRPNQSGPLLEDNGTLEIFSNFNVTGDIYTPNNIVVGGNVTFGNNSADSITFASDINSSILPDVTDQNTLGALGKRWAEIYPVLANGAKITTGGLSIPSGVNLALRPGKIWFVAKNGSDTNQGNHENGPFATLRHALSVASSGDDIYIYPGIYEEQLPLVVPVGVSINGANIRTTIITPDTSSQSEDVFLLNGESTVSNLTIRDFYYDSINDKGYAFRFAPNAKITSRSPYIQNITVITHGTTTTIEDPYGFNSKDAGKGALVDGSSVTADSKEASILFHASTFITPGADALTMTNGARVEWLNCFTYFANRGLYATDGVLGFAGQGTRFGAELRSIGSANVYGTYGAVVDGPNTLMYLINYNFAYIGTGANVSNDPSLVIQENETVELNEGKIYYQSLDHIGNFRVGDTFHVDFSTGLASISGVSVNINGPTAFNFGSPTSETNIDAVAVNTGNIDIRGNTISSLAGTVIFKSATGTLNFDHNVLMNKNLGIAGNLGVDGELTFGNQIVDYITFNAPVEFDLIPKTDDTFDLGANSVKWLHLYSTKLTVDNSVELATNYIQTLTSNANLELQAATEKKILLSLNPVNFNNGLIVNGITTVKGTTVSGTLGITGNVVHTGTRAISGNVLIDGNLTTSLDPQFDNIYFSNNLITTADSNSDLELKAAGTGNIVFAKNTTFSQNLTVSGTLISNGIVNSGTITANQFTNENILIDDNFITTTDSNSDLELKSTGGIISVLSDDVLFDKNLSVLGTTSLKTTQVTGAIQHTGNVLQTGNVIQSGKVGISQNLTVTNNTYFKNIDILSNRIQTSDSNSDLELRAAGTGNIKVSSNNVRLSNRLTVTGLTSTTNIFNSNTVISDIFTNNNIVITDNSISTTENNNLTITSNGTGSVIVENISFINNTISTSVTNGNIVLTPAASKNIVLNNSLAVKLPVGSDTNRPIGVQGDLRFNTTDNRFNGWSSARRTIGGGVFSADRKTSVVAHSTNNTLLFVANNISAMEVLSDKVRLNGLLVDQTLFDNNVIKSNTGTSDITLQTTGTGVIRLNEQVLFEGQIVNENNTPLILQHLGDGHVKFAGTKALVLPAGDTSTQPLAPELGDFRYNTETEATEVYNGEEYTSITGTGEILTLEQVREVGDLWTLILG